MIIEYSGLIPYQKGLNLQQHSWNHVKETSRPIVLGCEHYPVITLGKSADPGTEILFSKKELNDKGFELFTTDRGGQATLHSPGQLVIYPLIPIRDYEIGVRAFIKMLQDTTVKTLDFYGISAKAHTDAGVHTGAGKIAFIGIRVDRGITRHGISINIDNSLELFNYIKACGVSSAKMDSFQARGAYFEPSRVFETWSNIFALNLMDFRAKHISNIKSESIH